MLKQDKITPAQNTIQLHMLFNFYQIVFLCLPYLRAVALLKTPYLSPSRRGSMQNFNSLYVCVSLEETDTRSNLGRRSLGTRRTDSSSS